MREIHRYTVVKFKSEVNIAEGAEFFVKYGNQYQVFDN